MSEIKLEVGKTYRSRRGEEVRIVKHDVRSPWPYCGSSGKGYAADGKWASMGSPHDLIEEVARHTLAIPDGVKEITLDYFGNRIVVEMVPERAPKPGDVCINDSGSVYIFKAVMNDSHHKHYVWLGKSERLSVEAWCVSGRPATPEEAQPLWDALKKAGKRWNHEAMQVEDVPEIERIREWVEGHLKAAHYNHDHISMAIDGYLKYKEDKK